MTCFSLWQPPIFVANPIKQHLTTFLGWLSAGLDLIWHIRSLISQNVLVVNYSQSPSLPQMVESSCQLCIGRIINQKSSMSRYIFFCSCEYFVVSRCSLVYGLFETKLGKVYGFVVDSCPFY